MKTVVKAARSRVAADSRNHLIDEVNSALAEMARLWAVGAEPPIDVLWARFSPGRAVEVLAALAKADLKARFDRGERPEAAVYLERFATLRDDRERVVSLVYEEFCLREERGERPEAEAFCARYEPWRDSLRMQLGCHEVLSQAIGASPSTRTLPVSGDRFRSFRLGALLGQGGSARVFLAHDESLGDRRVALKVSTDRGKEPGLQGRLNHPHIVPVLSVTDDVETGLRGLCMPYHAGLPLDEVIRRLEPANRPRGARVLRDILEGGPEADPGDDPSAASWRGFPDGGTYPQGVAWIVAVLARALAHAHGRGVYHRDVKPANILLATREGPQLLDFNLSHGPRDAGRAESALRGGTLPYMAPEQLRAFLDSDAWDRVGEAADLYSLGLLLRELLTGKRPDSPEPGIPLPRAICELLDRRSLGFAPVRPLNPDVPHALEAILARCLAFRPEDRYPSARALADDLERFLAHQPLIEAANPSHLERARNWARRRRVGRVAGILLCLGAFGFAATRLRAREETTDAASHVYVAMKHDEQHKPNEALAELAKAETLDPTLYTIFHLRSKILIELNQPKPALNAVNKAVGLALATKPRPDDKKLALLYLDQATQLRQAKHTADAKVAYREVLKLVPDCHTAYGGLGMIAADDEGKYLDARGYYAEALECFARAKQTPSLSILVFYSRLDAVTQIKIAQETYLSGKVDSAKVLFAKALSRVQELQGKLTSALKDDAVKVTKAEADARGIEAAELQVVEARARIGLAEIAEKKEQFINSLAEFKQARANFRTATAMGASPRFIRVYDDWARDSIRRVEASMAQSRSKVTE